MGLEVRKKEGESATNLLFNFSKRMKRSGILKEVRSRQFHSRRVSRLKRRLSAIHRDTKKKAMDRARRLGII